MSTEILNVVLAVAAIAGLVLAAVKFWPEKRSIDSQTLERYQHMLDQSTAREQTLRDAAEKREAEFLQNKADYETRAEQRDRTMRQKITEVETRVTDLEKQLVITRDELDRVREWNGRLKAQVESLGEKPVPYDTKPRKATGG